MVASSKASLLYIFGWLLPHDFFLMMPLVDRIKSIWWVMISIMKDII
jgi:hypothetical protein